MKIIKFDPDYTESCSNCNTITGASEMYKLEIGLDEILLCEACARDLRKGLKKAKKIWPTHKRCGLCSDITPEMDLFKVELEDSRTVCVCPDCYKELEEGK